MTRVLLTGAGGFIAQHAARRFREEGLHVVGVARKPVEDPAYERIVMAPLTESIAPVLEDEPVDTIVHCAYDPAPSAHEANVEGTTRWLNEGLERGVGLQILLSSLTAGPDALTDYGRGKHELEERFKAAGQVAYRLGLVIGHGGMFARMTRVVRAAPVVPLLDGGRAAVHVLGIADLCTVLAACIREAGAGRRGRVIQAQQPTPHTLRQVMCGIRRQYGRACVFVPVPSLPVLWLARAAERFPLIRLPVSATNLRGLRQGRDKKFRSDFPEFGCPERSLDELIRAAAQAESDA